MRHDKESLAKDSVRSSEVGKLVGDYERIILFSAYARAITTDVDGLKRQFDPFTGCFISRLPITVTYLRFALRALRFFAEGDAEKGIAFTEVGARRIGEAVLFASEPTRSLSRKLTSERAGWELYYNVLDLLEQALVAGDSHACLLRDRARALLEETAIRLR
jgi:hypothetical protein